RATMTSSYRAISGFRTDRNQNRIKHQTAERSRESALLRSRPHTPTARSTSTVLSARGECHSHRRHRGADLFQLRQGERGVAVDGLHHREVAPPHGASWPPPCRSVEGCKATLPQTLGKRIRVSHSDPATAAAALHLHSSDPDAEARGL